ncbi:unnamed protein product [Peniophora sp. CBMAI 1063]|nr:unnamed protein product [Peniophora sp. CBMAI 1063]
MASRPRSTNWSLALLAGADIPFSILLGLCGALRNTEDSDGTIEGQGESEGLGLCLLRILACVFALVGGVAAFCATLGAMRAGFWRVYIHDRIARARAVALLAALAFYFLLDRLTLRPSITTTPPSISTSDLFNWSAPTSFLALAVASAVYARLYAYFLAQTAWYIKREFALGVSLYRPEDEKGEEEGARRVKVLLAGDVALNLGVACATMFLGLQGEGYGMLNSTTLCLLKSAGTLLFAVQLPLQLYLRLIKLSNNYHSFLIAYSVLTPLRAVVSSFAVGVMAWSVLDDNWVRGCAGGVLVVGEGEECRRGLWVRLAPLGVWVVVLAHAAFTISALNAYKTFTSHRTQFGASLRELNREFCRLARAEGFACRRCRCSHSAELGDVEMDLDVEGEFVLVVDAGQGAREVLVRERNLEAEVAELECVERRGEREVLFSADEGERDEEDEPLLSGPVSTRA